MNTLFQNAFESERLKYKTRIDIAVSDDLSKPEQAEIIEQKKIDF